MSIPVLSGIGDAFNFYQRNLHNPLSGSLLLGLNDLKMGLGLGDQGSQDMQDQYGTGMPGSNPTGALDSAFHDNPLGRFAYDTATDPLTYLGTGLFPAVAKGIGVGGAALDAINIGDKLPGTIANSAMDIGKQVLGGPALSLASAAEPMMAQFGTAHPAITGAWQQTNRLWKELNHGVPSFPLGNMADDASRQAAYGDTQSAGDMLSGFPKAIGATLHPASDPAGVLQQQLDLAGSAGDWARGMASDPSNIPIPHAVTDTGVASSGPQSAFRRFQDPLLNDQGAPMMNSDGTPAYSTSGVKNSLLDKLSGWGEKMKTLEQNQELTTRGPVWGNAAMSMLKPYSGTMANDLVEGGYGATAGALADRGGLMSPQLMLDHLVASGATPADAERVSGLWQDRVNEIQQGADNWTYKTQFKYRNDPIGDAANTWGFDPATNPGINPRTSSMDDIASTYGKDAAQAIQQARAEQVIRSLAANTFGGYKFGAQNVPSYLRLAGAHPGLANAPAEYYRDSDQYLATHGLPASMHGSMPLGTNPMTGEQMYFDPMKLSSMGELIGNATGGGSDNGDTALGSAVHTLGDLQLGVNPIIKTALQLTGQMGDNQMSDTFRPLSLLSGAGSVLSGHPMDLEGPLKNLVGTGEQAITGKETYPYQSYLVRKRTGELSPSGNQWNATQDSGLANDQAVQDVAHRQGMTDLLRTLLPLDLTSVSPEAQRYGQNQRQASVLGASGLMSAAAANPQANQNNLVDPLAEKVARFETLPIEERMAMLRDPRALELLSKQRMLQLHNPQQLAAG